MYLPITTLSAALLGLLLVVLSVRVIGLRRGSGASLGSGGDNLLERRIRGQGNLAEYAPTGLVLLFLAEIQGAAFWMLILSAGLFVVGRFLHGYALGFTENWTFGRFYGMVMTFLGLILVALTNLWILFVG